MARGTDQRIELELAVFSLTRPEAAAVVQPVPAPSRAGAAAPSAGPAPFTAAPPPVYAAAPAAVPPVVSPAPAAEREERPPFEAAPAPAPQTAPVYAADVPIPQPVRAAASEPQPFVQWPAVLELIAENDPMLNSYLRGTRAYYDGRRVLIECSDDFRDFMRRSKETSKNIKQYIYQVTHIKCNIGPYEKPKSGGPAPAVNVEDTLKQMENLGVDVVVEDK